MFFVKNQIIVLSTALFLGVLIGFIQIKTASPKFVSSVTVVQNYPTGQSLYNSVSYFNDLVKQSDYTALGTLLNIEQEKARSILSFEVSPVVSENEKLISFNSYINKLDSLAASKIEYKEFLKNNEDHSFKYQKITINSKLRNSFKSVFSSIVETISLNPFFVNEQRKDIEELTQKKAALEFALVKSDSLQSTYKRVLERELNPNKSSEIGITFEGSNETEKTKEFDLYLSDLNLRSKLVSIERDLLDKKYIVETISNKQDSGIASTTKALFGIFINIKFYYAIVLFLGVFIILLGLEFFKFLETYKTNH